MVFLKGKEYSNGLARKVIVENGIKVKRYIK
jgi:hypothetical protein